MKKHEQRDFGRGLAVGILMTLVAVGGASATDFTIGLKGWATSTSTNGNLDFDSTVSPGVYFSSSITNRLWISAGYVDTETDFTLGSLAGSLTEVDSDFIIGWTFSRMDVGIGYRYAKFETTTVIDPTTSIVAEGVSTGPMVYLGGGDLIGQSSWGYYWGIAYMFEDLDDDGRGSEGEESHYNGEAGLRYQFNNGASVLFGYRYKEYENDLAFTFDGPAINLAWTF